MIDWRREKPLKASAYSFLTKTLRYPGRQSEGHYSLLAQPDAHNTGIRIQNGEIIQAHVIDADPFYLIIGAVFLFDCFKKRSWDPVHKNGKGTEPNNDSFYSNKYIQGWADDKCAIESA